MKTLITGASGFVGCNLQTYLNSLHEVNLMSIRYLPNQQIDLKVGAIIHLAGKAHDLKNVLNEKEYFEVNTELTKQLFQQFLKSACSVFIYMSSVKAVKDTVEYTLTENEIPTPQTAYGKSKLAAEQFLLSQKIPDGKKVYILRPCMIHGPGNKGNLNLLYKMIKKGIPYPLGAFQNKRSFVFIENICFIIERLITQQPESGIYNIADDEPISTVDIVKLMVGTLQKRARILNIPPKLINILARVGSFFRLPFNEENLQKLTENYVVSNQKIKSALHIKKLPVPATHGFKNTFRSFQLPDS